MKPKPAWVQQEVYDLWTEGTQIIAQGEKGGAFLVYTKSESSESHDLLRFFNIGGNTTVSVDARGASPWKFVRDVVESFLR